MYGTIAKIQVNPDKIAELEVLSKRIDMAPGQMARYVFRMDANPHEFYLVAVFDSHEAYHANAASPEQHERFLELQAMLTADPKWHDGEIVDVAVK